MLLDRLLRGKDKGGSTVGEWRSVGSGDGAVLGLEDWLQCAGLGFVELEKISKSKQYS